ncbi:uncharacterized protein Z520_05165 [Fonsecaea multimorphosa CBS 102226]|uniref:Uncharacterized protein n=1 Tax=Fonsecaea multimorphosa CBS 102226 TaxID=1442371 RepID=A0A0D2H9Y9_9EURO|nr:uncharacterized protein Z520_05165 [Fonsecaea multimorphosa CBS 102226]KIX98705.1 hypothetical protein Z520_05165 [Fonsecaea multimorphosa CBS 102226]OAL32954.1 hypothetical protein AYO22_00039 [Fonsecaea multimorphosa]
MSTTIIQQGEIARLRAFHAAHFSGQPIPDLVSCPRNPVTQTESSHDVDIGGDNNSDDSVLGYYQDGVKRTLTDGQIKMFRHSEIQRLLNERRAARAKEEARAKTKESSKCDREPRKRRFEDEPATTHPNVDTLTYDEGPDTPVVSASVGKTFLWPILGQDPR